MYTEEKVNASVTFEFLHKTPSIKKYKVLSRGDGDCSPSGHILEGSMDGSHYDSIHLYPFDLCGEMKCMKKANITFNLERIYKYSYIRMVQYKGECNLQYNNFGLTSIDFYGTFKDFTENSRTINIPIHIFLSIFLIKEWQ